MVVTMGCGDACPFIPGKRYVDWELEDPKDRPVEEVRAHARRDRAPRRRAGRRARHGVSRAAARRGQRPGSGAQAAPALRFTQTEEPQMRAFG